VCSSDLVVFEEYAPQTATDFTASAQRIFDALKDKPGKKIINIIWAGQHPLPKIADLKPERFGIELAPGGNLLDRKSVVKGKREGRGGGVQKTTGTMEWQAEWNVKSWPAMALALHCKASSNGTK